MGEREEGTRLVPIVFADDDGALSLELVLPKERRLESGRQKPHAAFDAVFGERQIIIDDFLARISIENRSELGGPVDELVGLRIVGVRLEEHVLVEMR